MSSYAMFVQSERHRSPVALSCGGFPRLPTCGLAAANRTRGPRASIPGLLEANWTSRSYRFSALLRSSAAKPAAVRISNSCPTSPGQPVIQRLHGAKKNATAVPTMPIASCPPPKHKLMVVIAHIIAAVVTPLDQIPVRDIIEAVADGLFWTRMNKTAGRWKVPSTGRCYAAMFLKEP